MTTPTDAQRAQARTLCSNPSCHSNADHLSPCCDIIALALAAAHEAGARQGFDVERVMGWMRDPGRKPANLAFTAGPERQAAYLVEMAHEAGRLAGRLAGREELLPLLKPLTDAAEAIGDGGPVLSDDVAIWARQSNVREKIAITLGDCRRALRATRGTP